MAAPPAPIIGAAPGASVAAAADGDDADESARARAALWYHHLDPSQLAALEEMRLALQQLGTATDDQKKEEEEDDGGGQTTTTAATTTAATTTNATAAAAAVAALPPSLRADTALLRFLKARYFDPQRALEMYVDMAHWRLRERPGECGAYSAKDDDADADADAADDADDADADADTGGQKEQQARRLRLGLRRALKRHYPHFLHKTDRYGRPVSYRLLGRADVAALLRDMTAADFLRLHLAANERFREVVLPGCSRAAGREVLAGVVVVDLAGFSAARHFSAAVRAILPQLTAVDYARYPEHLGAMVFVNTPPLFRSVWLAVRPFLDPRTLTKVTVAGGGEAATRALRALIPDERLPEAYGGTSACDLYADVGPWEEEDDDGEEEEEEEMVDALERQDDDDDGEGEEEEEGGNSGSRRSSACVIEY